MYGNCLSPPNKSTKLPYNNGKTAPPAIAIINKAEANAVWEPSLSIDNGQIVGHIIAWAKLKRIINMMEVIPCVIIAKVANTNPKIADNARAFDWFMYLGTRTIPKR